MPAPKVADKAQDDFLRSQRQTAPQIIIGSSVSSSTGIPAEGLTLKPSKRTKEEEERLLKLLLLAWVVRVLTMRWHLLVEATLTSAREQIRGNRWQQ